MKKIVCFLVLGILLTVLITACASKEVQYAFPLDNEVVEKVLEQEDISWEIKESKSLQKEHTTLYTLENENDKLISGIKSYSKDGMKGLGLTFFPPQKKVSKSVSVPINENEWEDVFKLACTLYGNSKDYKKVYREFVEYSNNRRKSEYGRAQWYRRIDDTHFKVTLSPLEKGTEDFILTSIGIMNSDYYEASLVGLVNMWKNVTKREGIEILENITVSDIIAMKEEDSDLVKGIIIEGHLENIKKLNDNELPSTIYPNSKAVAYKEDYLGGKLVDDTGSIQVILSASSLNKKELGQVRIHHGYYFSKDNVLIISLSVLGE